MKHKHHAMIVAKAENMELVVFERSKLKGWVLLERHLIPDSDACDYFLCLPQHKGECFHWLNGLDVQQRVIGDDCWANSACAKDVTWMPFTSFMQEKLEFRIKPKKEKRWIAYHKDGFVFDGVSSSKSGIKIAVQEHELSDYIASDWQFIEIEVEV